MIQLNAQVTIYLSLWFLYSRRAFGVPPFHLYYLNPQVFVPAGFLLENEASSSTNSEEMNTPVPLSVSVLHEEIPSSYRDMIQDNVRGHLIIQVIAASV